MAAPQNIILSEEQTELVKILITTYIRLVEGYIEDTETNNLISQSAKKSIIAMWRGSIAVALTLQVDIVKLQMEAQNGK